MTEREKRAAIDAAKEMIQGRASKGQVKTALVGRFGLRPNEAGRVTRTAVRELYGSISKDPGFWFMQICGESTPLQRRYARRRYNDLMKRPESRAWRDMILATVRGELNNGLPEATA